MYDAVVGSWVDLAVSPDAYLTSSVPGNLSKVVIDPYYNPWVLDWWGRVYFHDGYSWFQQPDVDAKVIDVGWTDTFGYVDLYM